MLSWFRSKKLPPVALSLAMLALMTLAVSYSPTLYRWFCAATGYGGSVTVKRSTDSDTYALEFAGGRLSGRAGCNRFSGTYSQTGTTLTTGPIMATRMACPGRMAHERTVMNLLRGPVTISFPDGDTMLLAGNGVTVRLVRQ